MARLKRILVVDDELPIRVLLSDALTEEGFDVSMAEDGCDSLDQLEKRTYDLVITDIQMPRLDGISLIRWMKKMGRKEKIIIMTGGRYEEKFKSDDMTSVVDHLYKPFKMDNFISIVNSVIFKKRRESKTKQISPST